MKKAMKLKTRILGLAVSAMFVIGGIAQTNAQGMETLSKKQQAVVLSPR